jgi:hypothetical protein
MSFCVTEQSYIKLKENGNANIRENLIFNINNSLSLKSPFFARFFLTDEILTYLSLPNEKFKPNNYVKLLISFQEEIPIVKISQLGKYLDNSLWPYDTVYDTIQIRDSKLQNGILNLFLKILEYRTSSFAFEYPNNDMNDKGGTYTVQCLPFNFGAWECLEVSKLIDENTELTENILLYVQDIGIFLKNDLLEMLNEMLLRVWDEHDVKFNGRPVETPSFLPWEFRLTKEFLDKAIFKLECLNQFVNRLFLNENFYLKLIAPVQEREFAMLYNK